jgi:hypothetical protein
LTTLYVAVFPSEVNNRVTGGRCYHSANHHSPSDPYEVSGCEAPPLHSEQLKTIASAAEPERATYVAPQHVVLSGDLPEFYMDGATLLRVAWCAAAKTWMGFPGLRRRWSVTVPGVSHGVSNFSSESPVLQTCGIPLSRRRVVDHPNSWLQLALELRQKIMRWSDLVVSERMEALHDLHALPWHTRWLVKNFRTTGVVRKTTCHVFNRCLCLSGRLGVREFLLSLIVDRNGTQ